LRRINENLSEGIFHLKLTDTEEIESVEKLLEKSDIDP
jgi:hypothetical protein